MRRRAALIALGVAWSIVTGPSAGAGAACRWVVDPRGDALGAGSPAAQAAEEPQLDLLEAHISSSRTSLQLSVRVADLGVGEESALVHDRIYSTILTVADSRVVLVAAERRGVFSAHVESAADGGVGTGSPPPQPATVSVQRRADTLVIDAPFTSLARFVQLSPRAVVQRATLVASREVAPTYPVLGAPVVSARPDADDARTDRTTYTLGDRSCRRE